MTLLINTSLAYYFAMPTDFLLQIEAAMIPEQFIENAAIACTPTEHFTRVAAQDAIGDRIWVRHEGKFEATYSARVSVHRLLADISMLEAVPPHQLPGETVQYLMDSRYCPAWRFQSFVEAEFGGFTGGMRIAAMRDWIARWFSYVPGSSDANTTALDSFVERRGVCRDFAHVMISFARASAIPARFVSVYAPDVMPQDFHAVAEVFLAAPDGNGGTWQLVDATGMANPAEIAKIGVGRDAADASFLSSYGYAELMDKQITVTRT
ncbi:transglutaminase-like domain-containing protein [Novosphingobium lentum]|uniref:transglutaminase-like domain-containing protein n=1 Tax=Novosphingobium lentum TaxID=145287 RepID=UPI00082C0410|nr:transglutaminase family protein [Novosphingobium lentum]